MELTQCDVFACCSKYNDCKPEMFCTNCLQIYCQECYGKKVELNSRHEFSKLEKYTCDESIRIMNELNTSIEEYTQIRQYIDGIKSEGEAKEYIKWAKKFNDKELEKIVMRGKELISPEGNLKHEDYIEMERINRSIEPKIKFFIAVKSINELYNQTILSINLDKDNENNLKEIEDKKEISKELDKSIIDLKRNEENIDKSNKELRDLKRTIKDFKQQKENDKHRLEVQNKNMMDKYEKCKNEIDDTKQQLDILKMEVNEYEQRKKKKQEEYEPLQKKFRELKEKNKEEQDNLDRILKTLNLLNTGEDKRIEDKDKRIEDKDKTIEGQRKTIERYVAEIKKLDDIDKRFKRKEKSFDEKAKEIVHDLRKVIKSANAI